MPASAATVMMTDVSVEMPQPGTSSSDGAASVTRYHQMTEPINNNNITNNNSNGEASQVAESSGDMSSRSAQHDEIDDDEMELAALPRKYEYYFMPNKSQVLFYLSDASLLRIRRAGTELQVTDSIDFPLFDIWMESNCAKSTMVLESYGKTVLLISESLGIGCLLRRKSEPPVVAITDWNADLFGYFIPGDPFLIEDSDKRTIAKVLATENAYGRATVWVCILEGSGREIARFEDYSTIYFTKDVGGFQLKLLALAAFARLAASECIQTQSCCCSFLSLLFRC